MSQLEVDKVLPQSGTTLTLGESGDTISIPAGATLVNSGTATGFGLTWQSVQTTGFTAVKGNAYPVDTTSTEITVTLPATPSAGDQVQIVDYAGTADTNQIIIDPNGNKIESGIANLALKGEREGVILTYIDSTQGWLATSGINEGTDALVPPTVLASYLVVAGGGGGGVVASPSQGRGGGGGAGGLKTGTTSLIIGNVYTAVVGAGGATNTSGVDSSLSGTGITTVTSTGGGFGGKGGGLGNNGGTGGSGGGGATFNAAGTGGAGTSGQGNNGGNGTEAPPAYGAGGGGGASAVGANGTSTIGGNGGNGSAYSITGSSVTYAGGGGGGRYDNGTRSTGGTGGGGDGGNNGNAGVAGGTNLGGGGGGGRDNFAGGSGGSGVVILSVPTANYSNTTTGSPTVTTSGSNTIIKFTSGTGTYTA
jgi:hypothetical protein